MLYRNKYIYSIEGGTGSGSGQWEDVRKPRLAPKGYCLHFNIFHGNKDHLVASDILEISLNS